MPAVGHGPDQRAVPELFTIWTAPVGTPPWGMLVVAGPSPARIHSDRSGRDWLVTRNTSSTVPDGTPVKVNAGEVSAPSQVKAAGIAPPFVHAGVVTVNEVPRMTAPAVVDVPAAAVVDVDPTFCRAGAVAPGAGSRRVRPLVPQAVAATARHAVTTSARAARRDGGRFTTSRLGAGRRHPASRRPVACGPMADRCLLSVHAHPDDEASKGASTVARYKAEGVRAVLVTCTGGEEGDILNPVMDRPEVRADLHGVRMRELEAAAALIGYDDVVLLGYRDSGMPGSEANARPEAFANADLDEAVARLVEIIRRERPQVILTYGDDQQGYPHPDHLRVHDISVPAFDLAGNPTYRPDLGDPFTPLKMYYSVWTRARISAMHEKFIELGLESPFTEEWFSRPNHDDRVTTVIDIGPWFDVRLEALLAHATQVDPDSAFWFGLPREVARTVHPVEEYILGRSRVETEFPETDLFAGVDE